jgi:hypothetical protein
MRVRNSKVTQESERQAAVHDSYEGAERDISDLTYHVVGRSRLL